MGRLALTLIKYGLGQYGNGTGDYRSSSKQTEYTLTTKIIKALELKFPYAFVMKTHGGAFQRSGIPDLYVSIRGKSVWIEIKRPGADTTALQKSKLEQIANTGTLCGTVESPERAIEVMQEVLQLIDLGK